MSFGWNALVALADAHFPDATPENPDIIQFIKPPDPQQALNQLMHTLGSGVTGSMSPPPFIKPRSIEFIPIVELQDEEAYKIWSLQHPKASQSCMFLGQEPFISKTRRHALVEGTSSMEPQGKKRKRSRRKKKISTAGQEILVEPEMEEEDTVTIEINDPVLPDILPTIEPIQEPVSDENRVVFLDEPEQQQETPEAEFDYEYEHFQSLARQNRAKMDAQDKEMTWASIQKSKPFIPELNNASVGGSLPVGVFSQQLANRLEDAPPSPQEELEEGEEPDIMSTHTLLQRGLPVDAIPLSVYQDCFTHCLMKRTFVNQIRGWFSLKQQLNPFVPLEASSDTQETVVWPVLPVHAP